MLSDLVRNILCSAEDDLSTVIDEVKSDEKYKEALEGKFGDVIDSLLGDLKNHSSVRQSIK